MKMNYFRFLFIVTMLFGLYSMVLTQDKLNIAVIPKSTTRVFWKSVYAGVKLGAFASSRVEIHWNGPQRESDKAEQIAIVEQYIAEGVSGIVLAPVDMDALAVSVAKALKKNIPVVILDSPLKGTPGKDYVSFVVTDNKKSGFLAGEHLAKLMGGKGKIVVMEYVTGQVNIMERDKGFLEAIAKYPGIQQLTVKKITAGGLDEAQKVCMEITESLKQADGVFCPNESTTMGMLVALRNAHLTGKIKFVGFDTSTPLVEAVRNGEINALIAQEPARIGFWGVKTIVDHIRGKKVPSTIYTNVHLITRENLNDTKIKNLLADEVSMDKL